MSDEQEPYNGCLPSALIGCATWAVIAWLIILIGGALQEVLQWMT